MKCPNHLILMSFLTILTISAYSQTDVSINPIALLFKSINASAEQSLSENFGLEGSVSFNFPSYDVLGEDLSSRGFGIRALGKYYFKPEKAIDKFHIGPYARLGYNSIDYSRDKVSNFRFAIGFYTGYKWVSQKNIIFEIGIGVGRAFINNYSSHDTSITVDDWPGFAVDATGKLAIGYRF